MLDDVHEARSISAACGKLSVLALISIALGALSLTQLCVPPRGPPQKRRQEVRLY